LNLENLYYMFHHLHHFLQLQLLLEYLNLNNKKPLLQILLEMNFYNLLLLLHLHPILFHLHRRPLLLNNLMILNIELEPTFLV
jgi:hypothetical protein